MPISAHPVSTLTLRNFWKTLPVLALACIGCLSAAAQLRIAPNISTYAGTGGSYGFAGDGGAATSAKLGAPSSVAIDRAGNHYIADSGNNRIRMIDPSGTISTIAGTGTSGYSGDGGAATSAKLYNPIGVSLDTAGNLYVADEFNNRIRKITRAGIISTVAGTGTAGYSGDGGAATSAKINMPWGVAVDAAGNLYIADTSNARIRMVNTSGTISTVAGNGTANYNGDGTATSAELDFPTGVTVDARGNLYIADAFNSRIRKVTAGVLTTIAGTGSYAYTGDGGPATLAALKFPYGVGLDGLGNLYIADEAAYVIREIDTTGTINTVAGTGTYGYAGDGGAASSARFEQPYGVTVDESGNLFIADTVNYVIREVESTIALYFPQTAVGQSSTTRYVNLITTTAERITSITAPVSPNGQPDFTIGAITGCSIGTGVLNPAGTTCTVPITFNPQYPGLREVPLQAITSAGNINFAMDGVGVGPQAAFLPGTITTYAGTGVGGTSGDGGAATSAKIDAPWGMAMDLQGNLYFASSGGTGNDIRKVDTGGTISRFAGNGTGTAGFSGDGGAATSAELNNPSDVKVDASGNFYIADTGNQRIRKVTPAGVISTYAGNGTAGYSGDGSAAVNAELRTPAYVALDRNGNLYITDTGNCVIRKVDAGGTITTVAGNGTCAYSGDGGAATSAELYFPGGIQLDKAGNLYIADGNCAIRKVDLFATITTVAGGVCGYGGDGGLATAARLYYPSDVKLDAAGNLYIADDSNARIRKVDAATNIISTMAGTGTAGDSGDNGPATSAELYSPRGIALDVNGNLYFSDNITFRIRKITAGQTNLNFATPTAVGTTDSADGPQTVTVSNIGNDSLIFAVPSSGTNPSIASSFAYNSGSTCPQLSTSSSPYTLGVGAVCTYSVDFIPAATGSISGSLVLTDNALNTAGSTQTVTLTGTGN